MPSIWIVSEDAVLSRSLGYHLQSLGEVATGPPERSHWADEAREPDLMVAAAVDEPSGELARLERLLEFVRGVEPPRRALPPVLFLEPTGGHPSRDLATLLIDDRPLRPLAPPFDPDTLVEAAASLLDAHALPPSLRERARRDWVLERVTRYYASLELPALRHAVDPRNARRPVLLLGEPGTGCGLIARYVHGMAEPARQQLHVISGRSLEAGRVEADLIRAVHAGRVSVYLQDLASASAPVQDELAYVLGQSGLLGVEGARWIASADRTRSLSPRLRALPWLRVELPPLRERLDVEALAIECASAWSARSGRRVELDDSALEALRHYSWPGNLFELEALIDASLTRARGDRVGSSDLAFGAAVAAPVTAEAPAPTDAPPGPTVEPTERLPEPGVRLESGEPIDLREEDVIEPARADESAGTDAGAGEPPATPDAVPNFDALEIAEILTPLAQEVREPLLAVRTYANLVDQRPDDSSVRHELTAIVEGDLGRVEETLRRLERFAAMGAPRADTVDLGELVSSEIESRRAAMRDRALVILEEVERGGPPARVDAEQLRFALGGLLDRALRMVPDGGDLYVGSLHRGESANGTSRHRVLIRFHSPEDVLVAPEGVPGPALPLEVVMARTLIMRMGGALAVDASGSQDNVILIELPA